MGFIELLFALVIAEIATRIGEMTFRNIWPRDYPFLWSQLGLALAVVTTSWVYWKNSKAPGNVTHLTSIFSMEYLVLLTDVAILISYYGLVTGASIPEIASPATDLPKHNASVWMTVIFALYYAWDVFVYALMPLRDRPSKHSDGFLERIRMYWSKTFLSGGATVLCALSTYALWNLNGALTLTMKHANLALLLFAYRASQDGMWRASIICAAAFVVTFLCLLTC